MADGGVTSDGTPRGGIALPAAPAAETQRWTETAARRGSVGGLFLIASLLTHIAIAGSFLWQPTAPLPAFANDGDVLEVELGGPSGPTVAAGRADGAPEAAAPEGAPAAEPPQVTAPAPPAETAAREPEPLPPVETAAQEPEQPPPVEIVAREPEPSRPVETVAREPEPSPPVAAAAHELGQPVPTARPEVAPPRAVRTDTPRRLRPEPPRAVTQRELARTQRQEPARTSRPAAVAALGTPIPNAGSAGSGGRESGRRGGGDAPPDYLARVRAEIMRRRIYPADALARGEQGIVILSLSISGSGALASHAILRGSGSRSLDQATSALARRLNLPPPPNGPLTINIGVQYVMD